MILTDTSVWIDPLRHGEAGLVNALQQSKILIHPFVLGEVACGNRQARTTMLALLAALPSATMATDTETLAFIAQQALMGQSIGYVNAHLCAAARLSGAHRWTRDKPLRSIAHDLGCAQQESRP